MTKPEIIERIRTWPGRFLHGVEIVYKDRDGTIRRWESVERKNRNIVAIVLYNHHKGEFVLIEQYRPPIAENPIKENDGMVVELVAGVCDVHGENRKQAAIREAIEESGWEPRGIICLSADEPVSAGMQNELLTVFYGYELLHVGKKKGPEEDGIIVHSVPRDTVFEWLDEQKKKGKKIDAKVRGNIALVLRIIEEGEAFAVKTMDEYEKKR